jgi:hypothetical protein
LDDAPPKIVERIVLVFVGAFIDARQTMESPLNQVMIYDGKNSQMAARARAQPNLISRPLFARTSKWRFWNNTTCGKVLQYTISAGYTMSGRNTPATTNPQREMEKVASTAVDAETLRS